MKALEKDRRRRYETAGDLAAFARFMLAQGRRGDTAGAGPRITRPQRDDPEHREPAEAVAQRVAMAIESAWLRGVDQRRRAWMAYLAETSELLAQSLDVDLAVAVVPQVVVPRLGLWCAVHLVDPLGRLRLAALTHADEERLPEPRHPPAHGAP